MKTLHTFNKKAFLFAVLGTALLFFYSCSSSETDDLPITDDEMVIDEDDDTDVDSANFNAELAKLQNFVQPMELNEPELIEDSSDPSRNGQFECVVQKFKAAPGFDEMLALDPANGVIYPGAMLKGESIPTGEYIGINGGRAPITLSISLENIDGTASVEVEDPDLDGVRNSVNSLLAQGVNGATPADLNFTIQEVHSEEQLDIALRANYRSRNKDISGSFDFESSEYNYKYVVKFFQEYYTIDMTLPPNDDPGSLFTELPNLDNTSPVIVSSVVYGRMVLYTVESNYSTLDVKSAFALSFSQGSSSGEGGLDVDYKKIISESKIEALVIGGSAEDAVGVIEGPSGVYSYIINGGNYSKDSPGKPLAYTLRYIKRDFPIARVVLTSEYPVRTCDLAWPEYELKLVKIAGSTLTNRELYGNLEIRMYSDADRDFVRDDTQNPGVDNAWWNRENKSSERVNVKRGEENAYTFDDDPVDDEFFEYDIEPYRPDKSKDYFEYRGHLYDNEFIGFDDLGAKSKRAYLDNLGENAMSQQEAQEANLIGSSEVIPSGVYYYSHSFEDGITVFYKITEK
ncbi:thiol-activated cytolysin family protein [Flagellimonas meridianipacifica]|uniref:Thiol-activated cytolysin n=1 Tax=Flagellimonas meridianipacifica TaxID=1080225 RepID=A0A2T0MBE5_9FLAO|nr:thiol-activated cytolysin family protein [Allomuricauda pacifica]PRX54795.1 thiol-activated cytolysin [Allomuricauda pacifica]